MGFPEIDPFDRRDLPSQIYQVALRQQRIAGQPNCGTLDRLHLAAMELLGISRLLTHDARQAQAAHALGFEVLVLSGPRHS
jgi:predicted nucleic acid-binding protein